MGIALAEARRMNLSLPGLALAEQLYVALEAQGHGRKGTHALILALASVSSVDWVAGRRAPADRAAELAAFKRVTAAVAGSRQYARRARAATAHEHDPQHRPRCDQPRLS